MALISNTIQGILRRVKGEAGESITEVLVSLLISSFALLMLATMITSTANLVERSKAVMEEYVQANNELVKQMSQGTGTEGSVTVKYNGALIKLTDSSSTSSPVIKYSVNNIISSKPVVVYTVPKKAGEP